MANVPQERREKILSELKKHGYLSVAELANVLFVSISTVRRDLCVLEREGALVRTHGGASNLADDAAAAPYALRYRKLVSEKLAVGALAARLVKNGNRIFTDASTTVHAMIRQIPEEMNMIVLTKGRNRTGFIHVAFSVGSREKVDEITRQLSGDGYEVVSGPRTTGDGYYESCVVAIEGNQIEFTV